MRDLRKVGRVGADALVYFEAVTTLALVIGLVIVNLVQAGGGDPCPRRRASMRGRYGYLCDREADDRHRLSAQHHPDNAARRADFGRNPAGSAGVGAFRRRAGRGSAKRAAADSI